MKPRYSLPFKPHSSIRRCTAPSHRQDPDSLDIHCIDFFMLPGTPVLAARSGTVIHCESRWNSSFDDPDQVGTGNGVVIRHSDGEESVYWHGQWRSVRVKKGQHVRRGQILFLSGNTGYATYPHLHFGVYDRERMSLIPKMSDEMPKKASYKTYERKFA